jgi:hypothetical protein
MCRDARRQGAAHEEFLKGGPDMADDRPGFGSLDEDDRIWFLASLLEEGTPNIAWIANEHPGMLQAIWDGQDEMPGPDGLQISPRLHLTMHGIVETQFSSTDPPVVREVADRLLGAGWERHEVMHLMCTANIDELLWMLNHEEPFSSDRLTRRVLERLADSDDPGLADVLAIPASRPRPRPS